MTSGQDNTVRKAESGGNGRPAGFAAAGSASRAVGRTRRLGDPGTDRDDFLPGRFAARRKCPLTTGGRQESDGLCPRHAGPLAAEFATGSRGRRAGSSPHPCWRRGLGIPATADCPLNVRADCAAAARRRVAVAQSASPAKGSGFEKPGGPSVRWFRSTPRLDRPEAGRFDRVSTPQVLDCCRFNASAE